MTTLAALGIIVLALFVAYWMIRTIAAFNAYERGRADHKAIGLRIVQDEVRRHGRAVADAQAWAAKHHAQFDATRQREAQQAVARG